MINIQVWNKTYLEIESDKYTIDTKEDLVKTLEAILNKVYYSGERICLESVEIRDGKNLYTVIDRWGD